jgi:hypothetical protein
MRYYSVMEGISILEKSKDYVVLRVPRKIADNLNLNNINMNKNNNFEESVLRKLAGGMAEYYAGKIKKLKSLRDLR